MHNTNNPTVSVIVPVFNCEEFIYKCLKSIVDQTYKNLDIIAVNDGSTDNSLNTITEIANKDHRIRVIDQQNAGVCAARNRAVAASDGNYITFVDGDDYLELDYIEKMVSMALDEQSDLIISGFIFESEKKTNTLKPKDYKRGTDEMWAYRCSSAWGRLYRSSFWKQNTMEFINEPGARAEDVPLCLFSNYVAENIRTIDYAGYHYVQHSGSAMSEYVGLRKYGFPFKAMDALAGKIGKHDSHNSREYYEVGVLKFFAQFYYQLGFGAEKSKKRQLMHYFREYIKTNCPTYKDSWKYVRKNCDIPLNIWGAIELLVIKL